MIVETIKELMDELIKKGKRPICLLIPEWMWLVSKDYDEVFNEVKYEEIPIIGYMWGMLIMLDNELENSIKILTRDGGSVKKELGHSRSVIKRKEIQNSSK